MAKRKRKKPTGDKVRGIVMPMSAIGDLLESHWYEVKRIIQIAVEDVGYNSRIVSEADDANIFVGSIVQNLFFDPITVCDVSCKNPNVMFELGMRLAFDKPTVIIVDDKTGFTSDIQSIKHLVYPRDLRYRKIVKFKRDLGQLVKATHEESQKDGYKSFLKYYEKITPSKVETKDVSQAEFFQKQMQEFMNQLDSKLLYARNAAMHGIVPEEDFGTWLNHFVDRIVDSHIKHSKPGEAFNSEEIVRTLCNRVRLSPRLRNRWDSRMAFVVEEKIRGRLGLDMPK